MERSGWTTSHAAGCIAGLLLAGLVPIAVTSGVWAQSGDGETVASVLWQPSMNVFRRFAVERAKMVEFYGQVLGLRQLPSFDLGGGGEMTRFLVGTSEIKLTTVVPNRLYAGGPIQAATGLRVITFFFPDEAALVARFRQHGYAEPRFVDAGGRRVAHVTDPDGQWVELVVAPGAPPETFDRIEVGLTVSNLERSRAFYRDFVGLEELSPTDDPILKVKKYPYRYGTTTVNLFTFGGGLPANTGSAGIQYVVHTVDRVDTLARSRGVTIDTPLGNSLGTLRTIWLSDPDGITNYFAETAQSRAARPTLQ
jgi:catechol 2,3-dioxygenase-like lactoylglutathione lyase family enzyme